MLLYAFCRSVKLSSCKKKIFKKVKVTLTCSHRRCLDIQFCLSVPVKQAIWPIKYFYHTCFWRLFWKIWGSPLWKHGSHSITGLYSHFCVVLFMLYSAVMHHGSMSAYFHKGIDLGFWKQKIKVICKLLMTQVSTCHPCRDLLQYVSQA